MSNPKLFTHVFRYHKDQHGATFVPVGTQCDVLIDVLRSCMAAGKFQLHDFVIMPDHVHLLLMVTGDKTTEKAMQLIKDGYSYRLKKELGYLGEVWQRGFSELRVNDRQSYLQYREYVAQNRVKAGLVDSPEKFPYCFNYLAKRKIAGAKALESPQQYRHD